MACLLTLIEVSKYISILDGKYGKYDNVTWKMVHGFRS